MSENGEMNTSLVKSLEITKENGMRDASMPDISEVVLCDIPDYLSNPIEDLHLSYDRNDIDTSTAYLRAEEIIDSILNDPMPDFDSYVSNFREHPMSGSISLKRDYDENNIKTSSISKSAIVEFGCKSATEGAVEYELEVKPGDSVDERTIIGYVKQRGKRLPIRSIFSRGIVRKDESDNSFGRLYKPVCSRHIIIDDFELAQMKSYDGIDMKSLVENPKVIDQLQDRLTRSEEAMAIILNVMPYLMYLRLVDATASVRADDGRYLQELTEEELEKEDIVDYIEDPEEQEEDIVRFKNVYLEEEDKKRIIFESRDDDRLCIEEEFTRWIRDRYETRREEFLRELEKIYGGFEEHKSIKATCGNPKKLKKICEDIIEARERYLRDILDLMDNPRFIFPLKEKRGGDFWYTIRIDRGFGFKILKTFLKITPEKVREKTRTPLRAASEYDLKNPSDAEYETLGEDFIEKREESEVFEEDYDFREYFTSMSMCLPNGGASELEEELYGILRKFAKTHISSDEEEQVTEDSEGEIPDAREQIREEIEILREYLDKCIDLAGGDPNIEESNANGNRIKSLDTDKDHFLNELVSNFQEEAIWPRPTDYEYRGMNFKKYTFLNLKTKKTSGDDDIAYLSPEDSGNIQGVIDSIEVPDPDSVSADASIGRYHDHSTEEEENLKISETSIDDFDYWLRYLSIATMVGVIPTFWATGMIIPPIPYLLLPCIMFPIKELSISKCGLIVVIGLAIRGISINIQTIAVNMNQQHNSLMFPATMLLADIREQYLSQVNSLLNTVPMISNGILNSFKSNNIALLKKNKQYEAEIAGLNALTLPGKSELVKSVKEELGLDPRMMVNRLETDVKTKANSIKESAKSTFSNMSNMFSANASTKNDSSTNS